MRPTTIKKLSVASALLCLCLFSTAFAEEKNYDICDKEFWKEATVEKIALIKNPNHLCSEGRAILSLASEFSSLEVVSALVNAENDNGETALEFAKKNNYSDIVETLKKADAKE